MSLNLTGKFDKLDFIKTKKFCSQKNCINRMKRQATEQEKIFENNTANNIKDS